VSHVTRPAASLFRAASSASSLTNVTKDAGVINSAKMSIFTVQTELEF
jgi:uncharacterized protein (UPF0147 family)